MKSILLSTILLLGASFASTATAAPPPSPAPPSPPVARKTPTAPTAAPTAPAVKPTAATGYQAITLPARAGQGKPIESRVVADTPHVKTVIIILRKGATLPEHDSPHAAAIQALRGKGQIRFGTHVDQLSPTQMVLVDPGVKHEVIAAKGTDLVLLVHHMKQPGTAAPAAPAAAPHHHH